MAGERAAFRAIKTQAETSTPTHFIWNQYTERKKKPNVHFPDLRKPFLCLITFISLLCLVLAVVATINPVPAFSSSKGLLAVEAYYPNSTVSDGEESRDGGDGFNQKSSILPRIVLSERGHEEGNRQYNHAESAAYWDEACACYKSRQATTRPSTRYASTTFTTTTATGLITITPSNRPTLQPRPTSRPDPGGEDDDGGDQAESQEIEVNPGDFAALYLGITGACLQRRSGVLVCTSNSFSPSYMEVYELAGLAANVTAQLPSGTGGAGIMILLALIFYVFTAIAFVISALPRAWFFGLRGHKSMGAGGTLPDLRHQWTLILATGLAAISTFAIVACSVQLQNTFGASAAAVEAWDVTKTLKAKMLTAYGYLYASAVLGGLIVVASLSLIAYDFNRPWWLPKARANAAKLEQATELAYRAAPPPPTDRSQFELGDGRTEYSTHDPRIAGVVGGSRL